MSAFATIPKTAPFAEEEIDLLNRVVGPANALQRAWLAGFLAGVESVSAARRSQRRRRVRPSRSPSFTPASPAIAKSSPTISPRRRVRTA